MAKKELAITINTISSVKSHTCDYCGANIVKGSQYHRIETRIVKVERFPIHLKACFTHNVGLLPLSFLWKRKK